MLDQIDLYLPNFSFALSVTLTKLHTFLTFFYVLVDVVFQKVRSGANDIAIVFRLGGNRTDGMTEVGEEKFVQNDIISGVIIVQEGVLP
jgi:hypothetical protein